MTPGAPCPSHPTHTQKMGPHPFFLSFILQPQTLLNHVQYHTHTLLNPNSRTVNSDPPILCLYHTHPLVPPHPFLFPHSVLQHKHLTHNARFVWPRREACVRIVRQRFVSRPSSRRPSVAPSFLPRGAAPQGAVTPESSGEIRHVVCCEVQYVAVIAGKQRR